MDDLPTQASDPYRRTRSEGDTITARTSQPGQRTSPDRTQPGPPRPPGKPRASRKGPQWWHWVLGMALYAAIVLGISGTGGYLSGLQDREIIDSNQRLQALQEQFDLGVQDLLEGRHEIAQQRFDYILSVEPGFPGALELLEQARAALNQPTLTPSATASATSAATPTATLDLGSIDGLFASAQAAQLQGNWTGVVEALVALIAQSPDFRRDEVDQMLFNALRSRGLQKIWDGNQEQGIYDLALAERLFALDEQARSWRRSAAFYLFANSYFGLDWQLSTQHFSQVCAAGIWDGCFKYARSAWEYADVLVKEEDPCGAIIQYEASLLTMEDSARAPTATEALNLCLTATAPTPTVTGTGTLATITVSPTVSPTGSATLPIFTATPTLTPTPTQTPGPGATGTPTGVPTPTATLTPTPTPSPTSSPTPTLTPGT